MAYKAFQLPQPLLVHLDFNKLQNFLTMVTLVEAIDCLVHYDNWAIGVIR